ncbi:RPA-interacting protein B isoform X1 [Hydra vulgaris]|uniref:RPA-interacting protein B isoform X1 n=1 Tax=Hydra vulgaris TaxID=6087 RepID=UPI001F5E383E|nr:RPA-interacting protein B [Hydra vulgaris]
MNQTPERRKLKIKESLTPTGTWKDRFREGCLKRLKSSRDEMVNNFRNALPGSPSSSQELVHQVMIHEWEQMTLESPHLSRISQNFSSMKDEQLKFDETYEDIEDILNVFETIQQELFKEEQLMLLKYEDSVSFNERYLCATIDLFTTDNVMCPICKKNNLIQRNNAFICACGLFIDNQTRDLNFLHKQLNMAVAAHNNQCSSEPVFSLVDFSGMNVKNLVMICQICDVMEIIL